MKKFAVLFLSLMVLLLSAMPCCALAVEVESTVKGPYAAGKQQDDCKDNCCGTCSPFFSCSSCLHFGEAKSIAVKYPAPAGLPLDTRDGYLLKDLTLVLLSIWQPPKV